MSAGRNGKLYWGAAGADASTELAIAKDVSWEATPITVEQNYRGAPGPTMVPTGQHTYRITFAMKPDPANAGYVAIRTACNNATPISLKALDAANGEGIKGDFVLTTRTSAQPLTGVVEHSYEARPADSATNQAQFVTAT
ncbi:MAG: hypothetical protein KF777_15785 [Planctomycetaceae bacterium]|nr:hypothetical protein [Planctomycetaceae bacterium]